MVLCVKGFLSEIFRFHVSFPMFRLGHELFLEAGPKKASISNSKIDAFVKFFWIISHPFVRKFVF
jgi:hypothetical protein